MYFPQRWIRMALAAAVRRQLFPTHVFQPIHRRSPEPSMPRQVRKTLAAANSDRNPPRPLIAALTVLRRDGPSAVTLRAVAQEGGFSNPAIYRHYESKDALLRDLIREVYAVFKAYLFEVIGVEGNRERLEECFRQVCRFALDHPHYYELLFFVPHRLVIDRYPEDFRSGKSVGFRLLVDLVAACMRSGEFRRGDATDTALSLVAHAHGLVVLHQTGRFSDEPDVFRAFYEKSMRELLRAYEKAPRRRGGRRPGIG
jgi:AcrR family transcriptional regulator